MLWLSIHYCCHRNYKLCLMDIIIKMEVSILMNIHWYEWKFEWNLEKYTATSEPSRQVGLSFPSFSFLGFSLSKNNAGYILIAISTTHFLCMFLKTHSSCIKNNSHILNYILGIFIQLHFFLKATHRWKSQGLTNKIKKKIKTAGIITVQEKMMPTHSQQDKERLVLHATEGA